jgi:excisionase family DNA binding protein
MIFMPPKIVLEQHLRPAGLPDELINELTPCRYQGPGKTNPWYWQPDVERFVKDRRLKPVDRESYGEEGFKDMDFVANNDLAVVVREIFQWLKPRLEAVLGDRAGADHAEQTVTPEQAARQLKVNVQTIMRWCREGRWTAFKVGRRWLIERESLEAYVRKCEMIHGRAG